MSSRRGGRGRPRGGDGGLPRDVQISKKLSRVLRHDADKQGIKLGPGGYVNLRDLLNTPALKGMHISLDELRAVVSANDKQRFTLLPVTAAPGEQQSGDVLPFDDAATVSTKQPPSFDENDTASYLIRANQGHSIKVDNEGLLTPLSLDDPAGLPPVVVHGTNRTAWPLIFSSGGLKRMSRNHVHFASGLPPGFAPMKDGDKDLPVISGMRSDSTVLVYLDLPAALAAGLKFGRSQNGVILTEGDENGFVPLKFFKRVEDRKAGVLMIDGELPQGGTSSKGKEAFITASS